MTSMVLGDSTLESLTPSLMHLLVLTKTIGCEKGANFFLIYFFKGREDIVQCFPSGTRKWVFKVFEFPDSSRKDTFTLGVTDSSVESLNTKLVI
jgi:hypothetical protein